MVSLSLVGSVSGIHGDVGDLAKEFQDRGATMPYVGVGIGEDWVGMLLPGGNGG